MGRLGFFVSLGNIIIYTELLRYESYHEVEYELTVDIVDLMQDLYRN